MIWFCYNTHFPLTPARVYSGLVFNGLNEFLKPLYSIGGFEWILISRLKSAAFSVRTSDNNNLKRP